MKDASELEQKEAQRASLLEQASRIVASAEAGSGTPTPAEDQQVLELMKRVRKLEEEIGHLKRQAANT